MVRLSDGKRGWHCVHAGLDCDRCYAEVLNNRWGTKLPYTADSTDKVEWRLNRKELAALLKLREPHLIFLGDMIDLHADFVPYSLLVEVYETMLDADWHIFQVQTKRPHNMATFVDDFGDLPSHIWAGTSCGAWMYKKRLDQLRMVNAQIRYANFEPLIDTLKPPVDLSEIDWAIVGGESGPNYRPMNLNWAREILKECRRQNVAYFFKQNSGLRPGTQPRALGRIYHEYPINLEEWRTGQW